MRPPTALQRVVWQGVHLALMISVPQVCHQHGRQQYQRAHPPADLQKGGGADEEVCHVHVVLEFSWDKLASRLQMAMAMQADRSISSCLAAASPSLRDLRLRRPMNKYSSAMFASCGPISPTSLMEIARLMLPPSVARINLTKKRKK
eukprot:CAMPEP_0202367514 /NCGR_PEP_ID=MMETSP1126-20121109/17690_1 /ASSEMBLY_ACC=CAM_ASM_000457 /TAXON_ID=3047 /ORGANISM="Dunaliella tertiolecta, Strain CCMP1320" /LENGTH=146 /DNA_ID=CAMNT_0048962769 /DNA_START=100 /DNA_END=541 /DNA_ORIENTATION=-